MNWEIAAPHVASSIRALGGTREDSLQAVVTVALAQAGIGLRSWTQQHLWQLIDGRPAYALEISATVDHAGTYSDLSWRLPALVDRAARQSCPESVALGGHEGCYAGRALVPRAGWEARPGLRCLLAPPEVNLDPDLVDRGPIAHLILKPDFGPGLRLRASDLDPPSRAGTRRERALGRWVALVAELGRGSHTRRGFFAATTRDAVLSRLDGAVGPDALRKRLGELVVEALRDPDRAARQRLGPENARLTHYGDALTAYVVRCLPRSVPARLRPDAVGAWLSLAVERRMPRFLSGERSPFEPDDTTDTLAWLERRRMVSVFGPDGLAGPVRGLLDLRDLHPGWRGELCPLHTPESEKIGLVRYLTLDGDLSASAALIPFVNHNEPARAILATKNLKQAIPVTGAEPPLVGTGVEAAIGDRCGVARAPRRGTVEAVAADRVILRVRDGSLPVGFGPADAMATAYGNEWRVLVRPGDAVAAGQIVAHAPDVALTADGPTLALGVNLLVALTPWHGLNFEDALVISSTAAAKLGSRHRSVLREQLAEGEWFMELQSELPRPVQPGEPLVAVGTDQALRYVRAVEPGELEAVEWDAAQRRLALRFASDAPLEIGDKLTNRHGAKGVVAAILPEDEMPRLPDSRVVELVANPLGVVRRLNLGQAFEMAVGLVALLRGETGLSPVGRRIDDREALNDALSSLGAPGGRLPLRLADGSPVGDAPILVGPQYLLKLQHTARSKMSVRGRGPLAPVSQQPTATASVIGGRRVGAAQRLGEMELWALQAVGAAATLADALRVRSDPADPTGGRGSWRSVVAHLGAAGLDVTVDDGRVTVAPLAGDDLDAFGADELLGFEGTAWQGHSSLVEAAHPLYDPGHGSTAAERLTLRRCFGLPVLIRHPWTGEPMASLPVLPPGFRVPGREPLDRLYVRIGRLLAPPIVDPDRAARNTVRAGWTGQADQPRRLRELVWRVIGTTKRGLVDLGSGERVRVPRSSPGCLLDRLQGKSGLLRHDLLGTSVNDSGRAVMVPDPRRDPETIGLPEPMYARLIGSSDDPVVLVNRHPTLRPNNLVAVLAQAVPGHAIALHPQLLEGLAGDFDGDTVAVHRPRTRSARQEVWARLRPAATLHSLGNGAVLAKADLDLALGHDRTGPPGAVIATVAAEAAHGSPADQLARVAAAQARWWAAATGWSLGLVDLPRLAADAVPDALGTPPADGLTELAALVQAGAAGSLGAVTQLLARRGRLPSFNPHLPLVDVDGCFLDGLDDDEYFHSTRAGSARLAEKKLLTPYAGALTKTLVEIGYEAVISATDCGHSGADRSPLTCASPDPCQRCYGPRPGAAEPPEVGARVGVLAGMLLGERATQLSMKAFHGGGTAATIDVAELRAIFGDGPSRTLAELAGQPEPLRCRDFLAGMEMLEASDRNARLGELARRVSAGVSGAVAPVHVLVLLRRLVEAASDDVVGGLARWAERRGRDPLVRATSRGSVTELLRPPGAPPSRQRHRLDLMLGRYDGA